MKNLDKEDKIILISTAIVAIIFIGVLIGGIYLYPNEWNIYYLFLTISLGVITSFGVISFINKKIKKK